MADIDGVDVRLVLPVMLEHHEEDREPEPRNQNASSELVACEHLVDAVFHALLVGENFGADCHIASLVAASGTPGGRSPEETVFPHSKKCAKSKRIDSALIILGEGDGAPKKQASA